MYEQSYNNAGIPAIAWFVILAVYFYFAWSQYKIAQKVGCADRAWWAFVPVMNTFLLIRTAAKEWWWFLFLLVPVVNVFMFAILWMETARACGHSPLWGFLVLVPFLNFVAVGVMAFSTYGGHPVVGIPTSGQLTPRRRTPVP